MMCEQPYMRSPTGVKRVDALLYKDHRDSVTPFPCGLCLPCKINKAREWTHRILLETTQHGDSLFVTLTYNDDAVPKDYSLHPHHLTNFLKRLRRRLEPRKFRYFAIGEYGTNGQREVNPHFHLVMYNVSLFDSELIEEAWNNDPDKPNGFVYLGDVNKNSARYITGYCVKKMTKKHDSRLEYIGQHGDLCRRHAEFMRSSRKNGGIGKSAIDEIGKKLLSNPYFDKKLIRELQYGKRKMPLGRYLGNKMDEAIQLPQEVKEKDFKDYQIAVIDKHLKGVKYYQNMVNELQQERKKQKWKFENFKQGRKL